MYKKLNNKGFTMVELLVVMTIIAILVGISLVSFDGIRKSARDGKRKADLENIRSALELYRTDCRTYPATSGLIIGTSTNLTGLETSCLDVVYMETVPTDPMVGLAQYYYNQTSPNTYTLCAHLEGSSGAAICETNCGGAVCNYAVYNP